jgi:hypothetical protein
MKSSCLLRQTKKRDCRNPGLNRGPLDLQSNALPTELFRQIIWWKWFVARCNWRIAINDKNQKFQVEAADKVENRWKSVCIIHTKLYQTVENPIFWLCWHLLFFTIREKLQNSLSATFPKNLSTFPNSLWNFTRSPQKNNFDRTNFKRFQLNSSSSFTSQNFSIKPLCERFKKLSQCLREN